MYISYHLSMSRFEVRYAKNIKHHKSNPEKWLLKPVLHSSTHDCKSGIYADLGRDITGGQGIGRSLTCL